MRSRPHVGEGRRGPAGFWYLLTAGLAFLLPAVHVAPVFVFALVGWGFVFFMGMPAAFALLASRSRFPEERAGDAQAVMALGRVFGPLIGGVVHRNRGDDDDGNRRLVDHVLCSRVDAVHRPRSVRALARSGELIQRRRRMRRLPVTDVSTNSPDSIAGR